ncbi:MAG: hypothetical protein ACM3XM_18260 [Mycobacterium leprae]
MRNPLAMPAAPPRPVPPGTLQTLLQAQFILQFVEQSIQSVVNLAPSAVDATVTLPQSLILTWQAFLGFALQLLNSLPFTGLFPVPVWFMHVQTAKQVINGALRALNNLRITGGVATVPFFTLGQLGAQVHTATQFVQAAEQSLPQA